MKPVRQIILTSIQTCICILAAGSLQAEQIQTTGTPGSPSATTTISGKQLPPPDPKFGGVIKNDALQSKPWWAPRVVPPKQAPNILLIMTDDSGFGVPSTYCGVIPTPAMDRLTGRSCRLKTSRSSKRRSGTTKPASNSLLAYQTRGLHSSGCGPN